MQLRFECNLTDDDYVRQKAWRKATLTHCPLHPRGGCGFTRHGTYERLRPRGARVARWYCRDGHCTFSALPDCLAACLPGTLAEVEDAVVTLEQASSQELAAERLRPDIELPGVLRWMRRRARRVYGALNVLRGLMPECFHTLTPTLSAYRTAVGVAPVLPALRAMAARHLGDVPAPLGFRPHLVSGGEPRSADQHPMGPDPPRCAR